MGPPRGGPWNFPSLSPDLAMNDFGERDTLRIRYLSDQVLRMFPFRSRVNQGTDFFKGRTEPSGLACQ